MRRTLWVWISVAGFVFGTPTSGIAEPVAAVEGEGLTPGFLWPTDSIESMLDELALGSVQEDVRGPEAEPRYLQPGEQGYKSPGRAFFISLLIPGLGELYSGSLRGLGFLGVELLSWGGYFYYDGKGKDERTNYESFADAHYDPVHYRDVVSEICGKYENWPDEPDWPCQECEYQHCTEELQTDSEHKCGILRDHFLLPERKGQHYYEDLGKYDKYIFGWDDWYERYVPVRGSIDWTEWEPGQPWPTTLPPWDGAVGMSSANREKYRDMRRQSNDYLDRATYFTWFVLINHVASALDAAFSARRHNLRMSGEAPGVDVGMEARPLQNDVETRVYLRKRF